MTTYNSLDYVKNGWDTEDYKRTYSGDKPEGVNPWHLLVFDETGQQIDEINIKDNFSEIVVPISDQVRRNHGNHCRIWVDPRSGPPKEFTYEDMMRLRRERRR